jgi:hypothetical protein
LLPPLSYSSEKLYAPHLINDTNTRVYWGDTHLHASYSADAGMIGNTLGPDKAYQFALGHEVTTSSGQKTRIIRPLDFLVIADHAENLGLAPLIAESDEELLKNEYGKKMHDLVKEGKGHDAFMVWVSEGMTQNKDLIDNPGMMKTVWERSIEFADQYNDPGRFTAFIGYEWTSINTAKALVIYTE